MNALMTDNINGKITLVFMGIDPGASGAAAILVPRFQYVEFFDWPKDGAIASLLLKIRAAKVRLPINMCVIEHAQAMPKQGVKSMFSYGRNLGIWEGFMTALEVPHILVKPQIWQKGVGIKATDGDTPKDRARTVCTRLFPNANLGTKTQMPGRVDALLMAWYAATTYPDRER